jgi:hypothetical protein
MTAGRLGTDRPHSCLGGGKSTVSSDNSTSRKQFRRALRSVQWT